ncbi:MAG: hypothetical protein GW949_01700 [Spirochaetales bacterium]|nr:hypothetical protein [Spirochaetales bacterium]
MQKRGIVPVIIFGLSSFLAGQVPGASTIADFRQAARPISGWNIQGFADTVMGGNSVLQSPTLVDTATGRALRLAGQVVTRGGGFIQVQLEHEKRRFNGSGYSGVEIEVVALKPGSYYLFARTRDNVFPWSYYGKPLSLTENPQTLRIPWSEFESEATLRRTIRPDRLSSLAIVAAYQDFEAEVLVYQIGFY